MATINAAVDGIVLTSDATTALNIQSNGVNAIQVAAGGATTITTPTITNPATFPAGSASAPAITTTGDTNTGVYFPAADQVAVTTGGTVAAAFNSNGLFFRNRIINGDMRIDQRNAGASVTPTDNLYTLDRWVWQQVTAGKCTVQQSTTAPTGFKNSLLITSTSAYTPAAGDVMTIGQRIEGFNVADLAWGTASALTITVSFWVRCSLTGTFGGTVRNGLVSRSYPFTFTVNAANTFEYKTITIPGDTSGTWATDNTSGLQLSFAAGCGSTYLGTAGAWATAGYYSATGATNLVSTNGATLYITGVQLETGSVATPFERRPYGTELALCQRYFTRFNGSALDKPWCVSAIYDSTTAYGVIPLPVTMRTDPTITFSGATVLRLLWAGTGTTPSASSAGNATPQAFEVYGTYSGLTQAGSWMRASGSNQWIAASAEL